jgi:hypothetical protein
MRVTPAVVACALLLMVGVPAASADDATCVVHVEGDSTGQVFDVRDTPGGTLVAAWNGLFRFDGKHTIQIKGDTGEVTGFYDTPFGLLLNAENGLFRYDGAHLVRSEGDTPGYIEQIQTNRGEVLMAAGNGLFRYQQTRTVHVAGATTGAVTQLYDTADGVLLAAENGLFRYDRDNVVRVKGEETGAVKRIANAPGGPLIVAHNALFRYADGRIVRVPSEKSIEDVENVYDVPGGPLLETFDALFRYDGERVMRVEGGPSDFVRSVIETPQGVLLSTENQLFRYDGERIVPIEGESIGRIISLHKAPGGALISSEQGLFRYDGTRLTPVLGEPTGNVTTVYDGAAGLLIGADNGLFRYDGKRTEHVAGEQTGSVQNMHGVRGGLLLSADKGLFEIITRPLSTATLALDNVSELSGSAPSKQGVHTRWTMTHPCAIFADQFKLQVIAVDPAGKDGARQQATGFQARGDAMRFEAWVPVSGPGDWTFRVVSTAEGSELPVGRTSEKVAFVTPGFVGWLASWWRVISWSFGVAFVVLNLIIFGAARYSGAAWRLATDAFWGNTVLLLQGLFLRHSRTAQLWLLDLYVQSRRKVTEGKSQPFLPLPLTGSDGKVSESDAVLARLASARHIWIQGGAGMGKTATFLHLQQMHFGGVEATAFSIFRRDGFVLVPIEARRFPEITFDEKGASAWLVASVLSVLSETGLSFEDRGLLRAMLSKGTLAVAVDGLNEVGRTQAVAAFASEFPLAPLLITSQDFGEYPFAVWRLPATVAAHVTGLLTVYLGQQRGTALANQIRDTGLIEHLRSGYDVRLVIDLAEEESQRANLPNDRIGLYRAAVAAAWPMEDDRLDLLEAAAWKLVSERGPNEDKRRLKPDVDVPKDLLEQLEAARERSGRSIRLIRAAPPAYEFVHDQMNAYLAACWFAARPTVSVMDDLLKESKVWQEGTEAQRVLWRFVAALLDQPRLEALWILAGDDDRRAVLGRALAERAEAEGWALTRPPVKRQEASPRSAEIGEVL